MTRLVAVSVMVGLALLLTPAHGADPCAMPEMFIDGFQPNPDYLVAYDSSGARSFDVGNYPQCQAYGHGLTFRPLAMYNIYTKQTLEVGACVPARCSTDELNASIETKQSVFQFLQVRHPVYSRIGFVFFFISADDWTTQGPSWQADRGAIIMMFVFTLLATLAVSSTCFELWLEHKAKAKAATAPLPLHEPLLSEEDRAADVEKEPDHRSLAPPSSTPWSLPRPMDHKSVWMQVWMSFGAMHNASRMMSVNAERSGKTAVLNGIRVLSIALVVIGHTVFWGLIGATYSNMEDVVPPHGVASQWTFQIIPSAEFAVDSFFLMSGFLGTLSLIRRLERSKKRFFSAVDIAVMFAHRYLRLTPVYAFLLFVLAYIMPHADSGPFWEFLTSQSKACVHDWWRNLLYINAMSPWSDPNTCFGVSWYLSVDMMLFLVLPLLVMFVHNYPRIGAGFIVFAITLMTSLLAYFSDKNDYFSMIDFSGKRKTAKTSQARIYYAPWFRFAPYWTGVLLYMAWSRLEARKTPVKLLYRVLCYAFGLAVCLACFYGPAGTYYSKLESPWSKSELVAYTAMSRPAWGIGLACICGYYFLTPDDPVARFLSMSWLEPVSRLTYSVYLIHTMILSLVYFGAFNFPTYSTIQLSFSSGGALAWSYFGAMACFLLVEKPFMNLEMVLFRALGVK